MRGQGLNLSPCVSEVRMDNILKKLSSGFELMCLMSIVALVGDTTWLVHDIMVNGFSIVYGAIGLVFISGILGTIYVWIRHFKGVLKDTTIVHHYHHHNVSKIRDDTYRHKDD